MIIRPIKNPLVFNCLRFVSSTSTVVRLSDVKSFLYAWCGVNKYGSPNYKYEDFGVGGGEKRFKAMAIVNLENYGDIIGSGFGPNNRVARTEAAADLCKKIVQQGLMTSKELENLTIQKNVTWNSWSDDDEQNNFDVRDIAWLTENKWALINLNNRLWQFYNENKQTDDQYSAKLRAADELTSYLRKVYSAKCSLLLFGSTVTRLGGRSSDLDLCLITDEKLNDAPEYALSVLNEFRHGLSRTFADRCRSVELIPAKQVPILRIHGFVESSSSVPLNIDINVNNTLGIRNSHLLRYYSLVDNRYPALDLIAKHWAVKSRVCDIKKGTLTSYAFHLLVLHFLQSGVDPPVLPNLQQQFHALFDKSIPVENLIFSQTLTPNYSGKRNCKDLAELTLEFFDYYANRVDFDEEALSIYHGKKLSRSSLDGDKERFYIYIEEPFEFFNVGRCVASGRSYSKIYKAFTKAYRLLCTNLTLESIGLAGSSNKN